MSEEGFGSPLLHLGKVSKLASVVHRNGLKDLGEVFAILVMELIHEVHDRLAGCARNTERKVGFRLFLQQRKDNRPFSGTLANHGVTFPMSLLDAQSRNLRSLGDVRAEALLVFTGLGILVLLAFHGFG